ncbi:MAG: hypothetical protein K8R23_11150 [Chthoniobacter sp.]|nr:hypothetical protein [Chthoniobacter sp.]
MPSPTFSIKPRQSRAKAELPLFGRSLSPATWGSWAVPESAAPAVRQSAVDAQNLTRTIHPRRPRFEVGSARSGITAGE